MLPVMYTVFRDLRFLAIQVYFDISRLIEGGQGDASEGRERSLS